MSPQPHMSPSLKLYSFLSKTTIHRSPPPIGSNRPTAAEELTNRPPWPHLPYWPTNEPPLGPINPTTPFFNHPTTPGPNHPPPVGPNQPTTSWPQSPHHPYAPTHPSATTPWPYQSSTPDPNHSTTPSPLGPNHPSASASTKELEIIEKFLCPHHL